MDIEKRKQLAEKGWVSSSIQELLGLTSEEVVIVEERISPKMTSPAQSNDESALSVDKIYKVQASS